MTLVSPTIVDDEKHGLGIEGCQDPPTFSNPLYVTCLVFTDTIVTFLAVQYSVVESTKVHIHSVHYNNVTAKITSVSSRQMSLLDYIVHIDKSKCTNSARRCTS